MFEKDILSKWLRSNDFDAKSIALGAVSGAVGGILLLFLSFLFADPAEAGAWGRFLMFCGLFFVLIGAVVGVFTGPIGKRIATDSLGDVWRYPGTIIGGMIGAMLVLTLLFFCDVI